MKIKAQITVKSNPRILIPIVIVFLIFTGLILVTVFTEFFLIPLLIGLILSFFFYKILRFIFKQLASFIVADDVTLMICEYGEELYTYNWEEITFSGLAIIGDGSEQVYAYIKEEARLFTISREFNNFDALRKKIKLHINQKPIKVNHNETLSQHLREKILFLEKKTSKN